MASLNLGQDVLNKKRKKIDSCSYSGQILCPIAVKMCCYGSLININPSGHDKWVRKHYFRAAKQLHFLRHNIFSFLEWQIAHKNTFLLSHVFLSHELFSETKTKTEKLIHSADPQSR